MESEHEPSSGSGSPVIITSGAARCGLEGTDDGRGPGHDDEENNTGETVSSPSCEKPAAPPSVDVNILSTAEWKTEQVNHKSLLTLTQPTNKKLRYFAFLPPPSFAPHSCAR